jgi:hypothetical protein
MLRFAKRDVPWIVKLIATIFLVETILISGFSLIVFQELAARETRYRIRHLGDSLGRLYRTMDDEKIASMKNMVHKEFHKKEETEGFARNLKGSEGNEQGFWWDFQTRKYMSTNGFPEPGEEINFIPQDEGSLKLFDAYVRFGYSNREAMIKVLREWEALHYSDGH